MSGSWDERAAEIVATLERLEQELQRLQQQMQEGLARLERVAGKVLKE